MSKKIVITGASGWLGKETISVLSSTDFELKLFYLNIYQKPYYKE